MGLLSPRETKCLVVPDQTGVHSSIGELPVPKQSPVQFQSNVFT